MSTVRELHIGVVTNRDDPEERGRLKVRCASLMGTDDQGNAIEYPHWIDPTFPNAWVDGDRNLTGLVFAIPSEGAMVEFQVDVQSAMDQWPMETFTQRPQPRWRAAPVFLGDTVTDLFRTNYPDRSGWQTAKGHYLCFDDTSNQQELELYHGKEIRNGHASVKFDKNGEVVIKDGSGGSIALTPGTSNANSKIEVKDERNNVITIENGKITVSAQGDVAVRGTGDVTVDGTNVKLNGPGPGVSRIGDATVGHSHTFTAGPWSGTTSVSTDTMAQGSSTVVAGD